MNCQLGTIYIFCLHKKNLFKKIKVGAEASMLIPNIKFTSITFFANNYILLTNYKYVLLSLHEAQMYSVLNTNIFSGSFF